MNSIKENIKIIQEKIFKAEEKSQRKTGSVKLMAVSKFHPVTSIFEACESSQFLFGENRVQEACLKFPSVFEKFPETELHIIGSLQSNKVKNAVKIASCIQSVDRISLLEEIEKQCSKIDKTMKILFELHTAEDSKSGFESVQKIEEALMLFCEKKFIHINPCGFMTMAPFTQNKSEIHKSFEKLRLASEKLQKEFPDFSLNELSMGMSGDFEIAIEEGSTLVRVGTAIFGERNYQN